MNGELTQFVVPDSVELLVFFKSDLIKESVEDGYWCYEATDSRGLRLRFSFNIFERSVQTALSLGESTFATVSHEGATRMTIDEPHLRCEFNGEDWRGLLVILVGDVLRVEWSTLRTK